IVFGNPAGMSFLDRAQVTAGGTYLDVSTDIDNAEYTPTVPETGGSTSEGDMVPGTMIPFAFYAHPVNERLALGFGVFAPFGSKTDYEDSFAGRTFGTLTEVAVVSAQPTVSYRFNDQWAVGAGVSYNRVDGKLYRNAPAAEGVELDSRVEGDDEAWGYNLGVIYQPVPETTLGLTYRSKVSYTLEGDFQATAPDGSIASRRVDTPAGPVMVPLQDTASLDLTTPETVNFSVTQQMSDKLELMVGASWARWSRFDKILVEGENLGEITNEPQNYSNAWAFAVGGEYQLNSNWALRAGLAIDKTPTNDIDRSVRIPSDDRRIFSIGAGWTPIDNLTMDLAYSYLSERSTRVEQGAPTDNRGEFGADYKNEAHGIGAQLTYRF
ncbi:MAG: outer membrane protein transport protein, partial [Halomonas sp.]